MFKFLFVVLIIYFIIVILFRFIFPFLLKRLAKRMQRNLYNQNNNFQKQHFKSPKDEKINIDFIPPKSKTNDSIDNVGEYVDYEEI